MARHCRPLAAPNYVVGLNTTTSLAFWKFHVDWTTPRIPHSLARRALPSPPMRRPAAGGTCIPQSGTTNQLDSLADGQCIVWPIATSAATNRSSSTMRSQWQLGWHALV